MFLINKLFQFFSAVFLLVTFEILFYKVNLIWIFSPILLVLVIISIFFFTKRKFNREFFQFLISPVLYVVSCIGFSMFIEKNIFFHVFAVLTSIFLFVYFGRILDYKFYPKRYQPYSLENFSWYLDILTIFLFFSFVFALIIFLKVNVVYLIIPVLLVCLLLTYQLFWVNKITFSDSNVFIFAISLVLVELFVAVYYLPTSYFINSFILTIAFYLMTGLARYFLMGSLDKKRKLNFIIVSAVCLIVILATAQWV